MLRGDRYLPRPSKKTPPQESASLLWPLFIRSCPFIKSLAPKIYEQKKTKQNTSKLPFYDVNFFCLSIKRKCVLTSLAYPIHLSIVTTFGMTFKLCIDHLHQFAKSSYYQAKVICPNHLRIFDHLSYSKEDSNLRFYFGLLSYLLSG